MVLRKTMNTKFNVVFKYDNQDIDFFNTFTYLGVDLSATGNMASAIQARIMKANRAANMCKQAFSTS
jgi:hypothetical protein